MGAKRNNIKTKFFSYFNKTPNGYDLHKEAKVKTKNGDNRFVTRASDHRRQSTYRQKINIENLKKQNFPFDALVTKHSENKSIPVTVHGIWTFDYAECLTEGSKTIPVSLDLEKPVMFTKIDNKLTFETVHDVREYKKIEDVTWLAVTQRFLYNSKTYEPGDILEINDRSKFKNIFNSFSKNNRKNELNVISHPKQERSSLPTHLKGNFRICESPYTSCYRRLSDLVNSIEPPFLITLPINTNTGEVMCQGKVSFTKHNKRLLVMKKSTMNLLFVTQENDERIGIINLSKRDHIEVSDCPNIEMSENKENQNFDLMKQRILKNIKMIFDSKDVYHFDEKTAAPVKATKRKSFKSASFIKRRRSNTENVQMRNTVNEHHHKPRKEVTSLILTEPTSLSHSIFKSLKRFSYHPPSELYKAPSYKELLEKIDNINSQEKQQKLSVRDRNGYLVPVTGFSPQGERIHEFVNPMEQHRNNENLSDDDVEVGDDGYVLVTPTKRNLSGQQLSIKEKENGHIRSKNVAEDQQPLQPEKGLSNYLHLPSEAKEKDDNAINETNASEKGTCNTKYLSNDIYQKSKYLVNDVNKNNIVMKQFDRSQKPHLLPKPSTIRVTSHAPNIPYRHDADKNVSASFSKQNNKVNVSISSTQKINAVSVNGKVTMQAKRFSAIIDRFEKLSGSTDNLTYC